MSLGDFSMHQDLEDEYEAKSNLNALGLPWGLERTFFFMYSASTWRQMLVEYWEDICVENNNNKKKKSSTIVLFYFKNTGLLFLLSIYENFGSFLLES